ncbi:MAG: hypothetical protein HWQ35_13865 [Nostoc sp. NMS1]|uniref:hypothetical protein n=1 Tax=unclassified Nostoc TaxID=2593658 RepID=UPI0025FFCECC|nr:MULTISPECIES: hypothetical protein [unclassified Nostoc]MBN3907597.1 hypothetical protein [Nostoc sp. NMS1]MBN3995000.1 hypothetical protein [Nostoc sp. NMS2]
MTNRLKEIRDQLEQQGCPINKSLKAAQIILKTENKSLAGRVAAQIVINAWDSIWSGQASGNDSPSRANPAGKSS